MNRKIGLLLFFILLTQSGVFAQAPCASPPNCIVNGNLVTNGATTGDMAAGNNMANPNTVQGWFVSTGSPTLWGNAPGNPGVGMWMWSHSGSGERMFTCFNFLAGHTYEVCFQVQNTSAENRGSLMVEATNGLGIGNATPTTVQAIHNNVFHTGTGVWTNVNFRFTASQAFSQLTIYPFWNTLPSAQNNWMQYELVVDNIRVTEVPSLTSSRDTISYCDSAVLNISNAGPNVTSITWSPATGLNTTQGGRVVARPCSTTTYRATINSNCPACFNTLTYTIVVNDSGNIVNNTPIIGCGDSISLYYRPGKCIPVSYSWRGPKGNIIATGGSVFIPVSGVDDEGTYRLDISYANGCKKTLYTQVTVYGCCDIRGDFNIIGCNPVRFEDATTSATGATPVGWLWEFGDGATSTLRTPVHMYTTIYGDMTVCLTTVYVNGAQTCCDRVCKDFKVCDWGGCVTRAAFDVSNINPFTSSAQFTDFSVGTGTPVSFAWDFGDGSPVDTSQNPNHTFPGSGTYHVCFTVGYNAPGASGTCYETWCEDVVIP